MSNNPIYPLPKLMEFGFRADPPPAFPQADVGSRIQLAAFSARVLVWILMLPRTKSNAVGGARPMRRQLRRESNGWAEISRCKSIPAAIQ